MEALKDVIRRRTRALGLTQQALADKAGVHVRQIRRYESGEQQPVLGVAVKLAGALGVSLDELAGLAPAVALDGDWWAARAVMIDAHPVTVTLPVRLTQHGSTVEVETTGSGAWRGELRLWSGPMLTGWYAGPAGDLRARGTLLLRLAADGQTADGRWVGIGADGAIVTGHAVLARTRAEAQRTLANLGA